MRKPIDYIRKLIMSGAPWSKLEPVIERQRARNSRRAIRARHVERRWGYTRVDCEGI